MYVTKATTALIDVIKVGAKNRGNNQPKLKQERQAYNRLDSRTLVDPKSHNPTFGKGELLIKEIIVFPRLNLTLCTVTFDHSKVHIF